MTLHEWVRKQGHGSITRLARETGLSYTLIAGAAKEDSPRAIGLWDTARKISLATGGIVSIHELCEPEAFAKKGKRA